MEKTVKTKARVDVRKLVFTSLMAAISWVLAEFLKFKVPAVIPGFIKFDFSDVPAVLSSLTMGPVSGVCVCFIKNLIGCFTSSTGCVGELSNFILSGTLAFTSGIIAHKSSKLSRAVIGCSAGALAMALISLPSNLFLAYPAYYVAFHTNSEGILKMYQAILPSVESIPQCLLIFNVPFTFVKGAVAAVISILLYKRLRPVFNSVYRDK